MIEAGLECLGGRAVVNSVNFEDGDGPESRFARAMPIVQEHGAAVVVMCIDETGQARTAETKVAIAERTVDILVRDWGMRESDILVDCLAFTLGTGQEESRKDGLETIEAIRLLKQRRPAGRHHARPVQHLLRPQAGRPRRPQLGVPARVPEGRPDHARSCTPRRSCR